MTHLKQTSKVLFYQEAFEEFSHQVDGLPQYVLVRCFIASLPNDIQLAIKIKQPYIVANAIGVVQLIEEQDLQ